MSTKDAKQPLASGPMPDPESPSRLKGPIAWMARNTVAANLLMLFLLVGGLFGLRGAKQEVFPEFELDTVLVQIGYPGAGPSEVEQAVLLAVEEAARAVDGVNMVSSIAAEERGVVVVELPLGTDANRALADIKSSIDRITSLPEAAERPVVSLASNREKVITLVVHGDQDEKTLRRVAEDLRAGLLARTEISMVELSAVRPLELSIEVPQEELRRYGLTLEHVAEVVRRASVEVPGGGIKTSGGEVLVRTAERRTNADGFAQIAIFSRPDGAEIRLGEIAQIQDGFRETGQSATFNGLNAAMVRVFRVGSESPVDLARAVKAHAEEARAGLPEGIRVSPWSDQSEQYQQRVELLTRNALLGLTLVMVALAIFLELRLAFWVTLGIPISFVGSLLFLSPMDASINMISLFAFIITLGMVVDDAIVVGEAIYKKRQQGYHGLDAAVRGVSEVAVPVVFAICTTIMAFAPMLFIPGSTGKFARLIPIVVISVLVISLVECLFVLPAHLSYGRPEHKGAHGGLDSHRRRLSRVFENMVTHRFAPFLRQALEYRYAFIASGISALLVGVGLVAGGRMEFNFMPKVQGNVVLVDVELPFGAPVSDTEEVSAQIVAAAEEVLDAFGGRSEVSRGVFAQIGNTGFFGGADDPADLARRGSHKAEVAVYLAPLGPREFSSKEFAHRWRERVGEIPGVENLKFNYNSGGLQS